MPTIKLPPQGCELHIVRHTELAILFGLWRVAGQTLSEIVEFWCPKSILDDMDREYVAKTLRNYETFVENIDFPKWFCESEEWFTEFNEEFNCVEIE